MPKYIYMMVTKDKYELPLAVADTAAELSRMVGCDNSHISRTIREFENNAVKRKHANHKISGTFRRVPVGEDER